MRVDIQPDPHVWSGICGYTTGIPETHRVICVYDLENARPSFIDGFLLANDDMFFYDMSIQIFSLTIQGV